MPPIFYFYEGIGFLIYYVKRNMQPGTWGFIAITIPLKERFLFVFNYAYTELNAISIRHLASISSQSRIRAKRTWSGGEAFTIDRGYILPCSFSLCVNKYSNTLGQFLAGSDRVTMTANGSYPHLCLYIYIIHLSTYICLPAYLSIHPPQCLSQSTYLHTCVRI